VLSLTSCDVARNLPFKMGLQMRGHGVVAAALLIIAIIAVLGHICVLPVHAHAAPAESHDSHGEEPGDHSVHTASCDALKSTSATPLIVPAATWAPLAAVEAVGLRLFDSATSRSCAESPPLFLLHAALLI
jgi:hypothetical protein